MNEELKPERAARPFSRFEWMLAGRYLRAKRKETFISVITGFSFAGIMLGVATLIIVMAVMNGFRTELQSRILGINGHIIIQPVDGELNDYDAVSKRVSGVEGVRFAISLVEGQALVSSGVGGNGALVRGMSLEDLNKITEISSNIREGSLKEFGKKPGVAIGTRMARTLGLRAGDKITIISPEGDVTPFGTTPRVKAYPVLAVFEIGMSEYDATFVFMPLKEAQLYFNAEGRVDVVEVFTDDPDKVGDMRLSIEKAAGRPLFITDWRTRNKTFFDALEVERNVMFLILSLIILIAALNIISGLTMLVKDKGKDIAILRTMGATSGSVLRIFFITGAVIGIVGTLAGLALGVVICLNVEFIRQVLSSITGTTLFDPTLYFLSRLPAEIEMGETVRIVAIAIGLSFLATLFPAWRAAKLDPVEALRYE